MELIDKKVAARTIAEFITSLDKNAKEGNAENLASIFEFCLWTAPTIKLDDALLESKKGSGLWS